MDVAILVYPCFPVGSNNDENGEDDGGDVANDKENEEIAALEKLFANRFSDQDKSYVQVNLNPLLWYDRDYHYGIQLKLEKKYLLFWWGRDKGVEIFMEHFS